MIYKDCDAQRAKQRRTDTEQTNTDKSKHSSEQSKKTYKHVGQTNFAHTKTQIKNNKDTF